MSVSVLVAFEQKPACSKEKVRRMGKRGRELPKEVIGREQSTRHFPPQFAAVRGLYHRRRAAEQSKYIPVCTIIWYAFPSADPSAWKRFAPLRKQAFSPSPKHKPEASGFGFERRRGCSKVDDVLFCFAKKERRSKADFAPTLAYLPLVDTMHHVLKTWCIILWGRF